MLTARRRIEALKRQSGGDLPVLILTYEGKWGAAGDGLYYAPGGVKYTADEVNGLCDHYTVITIVYTDDWKSV